MADHILDKGYPVLSTYNSSAAAGVVAFRVVKFSPTAGQPFIDVQTASGSTNTWLGVVQENIDQNDVATGKAIANVRVMGVSKVVVNATPGTINYGTRVMAGSTGGVIAAASAGSQIVGIVVGMSSTSNAAAGDLIDVLLTPGAQFA